MDVRRRESQASLSSSVSTTHGPVRGLRYISGVPAVIRSRNFPPPRRLHAQDGSATRSCNYVVSPSLQCSAVTCLRCAQLGAQWSFENSNEMWQGQGCDQNDAVTARSPPILHLHLDEPHDCSFSIHQRCTVHPDGHGGRSRGCGGLHACLHQSRRVVYERGGGGGGSLQRRQYRASSSVLCRGICPRSIGGVRHSATLPGECV